MSHYKRVAQALRNQAPTNHSSALFGFVFLPHTNGQNKILHERGSVKKTVSCLALTNKALKLGPFQLGCEHAALQWNPWALREKCCSGVAVSGSSRIVNCPTSQTGEAKHNIPAIITFHFEIWRQLWNSSLAFILVFLDQDERERRCWFSSFQTPKIQYLPNMMWEPYPQNSVAVNTDVVNSDETNTF